MLCCTINTFYFSNESVTTIPIDSGVPTVHVYYEQPGGLYVAGVFTSITLTSDSIVIDHGGPMTGFVKILI